MNMPRLTNGYAVCRRALSVLRAGTHSDAHNFLATGDTDGDTELAGHLNRCQREIMNRFPVLNQQVQSLAMLSGVRTTVIPNTVRDMAMINMYYNDSTAFEQKMEIRMVPYMEIKARPEDWYNGNYTEDWPRFAVIQQGDHSVSSKLEWYGMPEQNRTVTLIYQASEVAFTYTDIGSSASTKYVMVPDPMIDCLAYELAGALAECEFGVGSGQALVLFEKADAQCKLWARRLTNTPMQIGAARVATAGFQPSATARKISGFFRSNRGSRGRW